jgi:AMMECR1 domain-containing protein
VIPEQGWTKLEALESAMRKAGWDGPIDEAMLENVKLRRYQSRKVMVTWDEYLNWKAALN